MREERIQKHLCRIADRCFVDAFVQGAYQNRLPEVFYRTLRLPARPQPVQGAPVLDPLLTPEEQRDQSEGDAPFVPQRQEWESEEGGRAV